MNITEYIVAYIRQGKSIEIPGIGTLTSKQEDAHFDSASSTFYPSRRVIEFSNAVIGQSAFLNYISEKECIGLSTADRLWHNYVDALKEKLEKESAHVIPGIGTLHRGSEGYSFELDEEAIEQGGLQMLRPVSNIKQYTTSKDPFAIFDTRFDEVHEEETAMVPEAEPIAEEPEATESENTAEETTLAEEPAAEAPVEDEHEEAPVIVPLMEPEVKAEEPAAEETAMEEAPVEEMPVEEVSVEEVSVEEAKAEDVITVVDEEPAAEEEKGGASQESMKALETLDNMQPVVEEEPKKKKSTIWILLLVLLLLLLVGGGLYYYLMIFKPAQGQNAKPVEIENMISQSEGSEGVDTTATMADTLVAEETEVAEESTEEGTEEGTATEEPEAATAPKEVAQARTTDNINIFTFNTDGIAFEADEIGACAAKVKTKMHGYVARYLQNKRTPGALQTMNDSVDSYIDRRMEQLLDGKEYTVAKFMNYTDYVRNYCMNDIKSTKGTQAQLLVQRELMDREAMDKLFEQVMASGNFATEAAPAKKVTMNDMKANAKVPAANIQTNSKRGFDVIAGFFSNKNNAQVLTANLKRQGCDAYIIQKGEFYYVSMGSAESRTKAESLYNHLKEWYDGDMVIKKW